MTQVEYRTSFYGQSVISIGGEIIKCGDRDIAKLFGRALGERVAQQYREGVTIFKLGNKQIQTIKNYFNHHD